ncbi:MAG: hypothetical protein HDKAJFGB_04209 [Anaerolineae bacterium]|nr:hypothetical protein [Anaerolineae bacterium]
MTITIEYPETILSALHLSQEDFAAEFRMLAAVKLFELGRISSGRAAELAGIPRVVFLHRLGDYGVPIIDLTREELEQDFANA